MPKAVKFSSYGGPEVLEVVDVDMPQPGAGEVLIEVIAAGLNPADTRLRQGRLDERMPARFPQGQGSDFAGIVMATGPGVTQWAVNDAVIGHASRGSHATHVVVPAVNLTRKPPQLPWEVAGGLFVTGVTAWAAVNALGIGDGDTVVISAAAGGVGCIAAQLAQLRGATVIGTASPRNHDFLRQIGVIPVAHGDGVAERIRVEAPNGVDAYLGAFWADKLDVARELGVAPARMRSVVDWDGVLEFGPDEYGAESGGAGGTASSETAHELGTVDDPSEHHGHAEGSAPGTDVVARLARLAAQHRLLLPISDVFALDHVRDAFEELELGHTRGKIVLGMHPVEYKHQRVRGASAHGVPLKQSASTVDVPTEHARMNVGENLPPVAGHLRGQHHPHPSEGSAGENARS